MFALDDDIMRQLRAIFQVEAAEHIQAMNRVLLRLEANPEDQERAALLEEIFREAHSLKGAAGAADFSEVEATAHKLEDVLGSAKAGRIQLTRELCDVLFAGIDAVSVIIDAALKEQPHGLDLPGLYARLESGGKTPAPAVAAELPTSPATEPAPVATPTVAVPPVPVSAPHPVAAVPVSTPQPVAAAPTQPVATAPVQTPAVRSVAEHGKGYKGEERRKANLSSATEETIRVDTRKIDELMSQSGELLVAGLKIDQRLEEMDSLGGIIEDWNREWLKMRAANSNLLHDGGRDLLRPLVKMIDLNQERLHGVLAQISELKRGFGRDALYLSRVSNDLGEGVMKVRMLPVATVFDAFPRLVRNLARERSKEIELKMEGTETELDRKVLEEIKDPLIHLLRNSVDHGIESPEERVQAGKPRTGTITVKAFQKGSTIVIEVNDDGGGINTHKVKQSALKAGVITADEMETLSDDQARRLIFASGLSTSETITDISGRGVGMDVVRRNVEALQGQVEVESTLGKGTTFALTLPLTLATTQELLVQVADQTYGIPITAVERIVRINQKDIAMVTGRQAVELGGESISLVRLADVLELQHTEARASGDSKIPVVILHSARQRIAFMVEAVVGQQESVVKSLGRQLARVRNVAGATILGSGKVIMTLNPLDLIKSVRGTGEHRAAAAVEEIGAAGKKKEKQASVLVVDDSLSTRTLEKNILETAGYKVAVATDGAEAWDMLSSSGGYDIVVSDVLMPRMTGIELTSAVKRDPNLKRIPVVLVTSLDSRSDKERGIEAGADAYLVKSNFDQSSLLETISQLV